MATSALSPGVLRSVCGTLALIFVAYVLQRTDASSTVGSHVVHMLSDKPSRATVDHMERFRVPGANWQHYHNIEYSPVKKTVTPVESTDIFYVVASNYYIP
ncbi:hypothetical protein Y032_0165g7 [Ancylostoma ceylanicum]|uniref:Uncharacterized protein n=1 Tax=Ancylostoma ceylanicum TaxID=53326 RepID=A0A016SXB5_9BILA|nr:hypothetical protein Y032_0165g7 [Ancylostoma ceylanicum]